MSAVIVIIDGAGAEDYAVCESVKSCSDMYMNTHTPQGMPADSLNCIMSMLGYPKNCIPDGRAYLEALAQGIKIDEEELVLRLNGVEIIGGKLVSSCVSREPAETDYPFSFYPMGSYKNLLTVKDGARLAGSMITYPPHENIGREIDEMKIVCSDKETEKQLNGFYAKGFWPWGQSTKCCMPLFETLHSKSAAMVCATEIVRGVAKAAGIICPEIKGATADTDTDLTAKLDMTLSLTGKYDCVFVHINGADEAAHRRGQNEKLAFMKKIDELFLKKLFEDMTGNTAVAVTSDHYTDAALGAHSDEKVPVYIFGRGEEILYWQRYL